MNQMRQAWRVIRAYRALRGIAEEHRAAGHAVEFVAVNEATMILRCYTCHPGPAASEGPVPSVPDTLRLHGQDEVADELEQHDSRTS